MAKLLCIFAATAAAPVWAYVVNPRLSHNLCFGRNRAAPALLLSSHLHNVGPDAASSEVGSEVRAEPNFLLLRAEGVSAIAAGRPASGTAACKYAEGTRGARLWTLRAQYKALMEQDRARLRLERERKELEAELEYLGIKHCPVTLSSNSSARISSRISAFWRGVSEWARTHQTESIARASTVAESYAGAIGIRPRPAAMGYSIEDYRRAPPLLFKRKLGARSQRMASDK